MRKPESVKKTETQVAARHPRGVEVEGEHDRDREPADAIERRLIGEPPPCSFPHFGAACYGSLTRR